MAEAVTIPIDREQAILEGMAQVELLARRIHKKLPGNVSLDDLVSAGTLGLIHAIDRYDPTQGVKISTYAEYKIRGAILDSLRSADWAPRMQRRRARCIDAACSALQQQLQRTPSDEEVAGELGISPAEYCKWQADIRGLTVTSLDSSTSGSHDENRAPVDFVPDDDQLLPSQIMEDSELRKLVQVAIERMPQVERTVLNLYYQEELTLREISRILNLHESRISQLKTQGLLRLRSFMASKWPNRGQAVAAAQSG
jgi:RNA polymerase sigma factor for flagellar operon FliA